MKIKILAFTLILCLILNACGNVAGVSVPAQNTEAAVSDQAAKPDDTTADAIDMPEVSTEAEAGGEPAAATDTAIDGPEEASTDADADDEAGLATDPAIVSAAETTEDEPKWYTPASVESEGTPTGIRSEERRVWKECSI